jgi:hypothetical protein
MGGLSVLGVALVDSAETSGTLQIRVDHHDLALVFLLASLVEDLGDRVSELDSACCFLLGTADQELGALGWLDGSKDVGALGVSLIEVRNCGVTAYQLRSLQRDASGKHSHLDGIMGMVGSF